MILSRKKLRSEIAKQYRWLGFGENKARKMAESDIRRNIESGTYMADKDELTLVVPLSQMVEVLGDAKARNN